MYFDKNIQRLLPKSFIVFKEGYKKEYFLPDLFSGITVAIVALPLAMAFAIASGLSPDKGLFTAIVAGVIISAFGGSRVQIGGPTGAFVVIVYDIVMRHGYDGLAISTVMAGVMLIVMGFLGFGMVLKFIPYPVITGFTSGIALIIFSSQVKDFFGLNMENLPADFIGKWREYFENLDELNLYALAIGLISITIIVFFKKYLPKIPGPMIAVIAAGVIVYLFNLPVETIETKFGSLPNSLPAPTFPQFDFEKIKILFPSALTIALLAAIESLLSAVVADGMTGFRHKSDAELVGQGLANIGSIIFGGIPATGAIARTATNVKTGAKTPLAGIYHGLFVLLFMFLFAQIIIKVPMASLAGILIVVAWNMSEIDHFKHILMGPKSDAAVLVITFLLTILVDLTVAVQTGVVMAALLFIKRISEVTAIKDQKTAFLSQAATMDETDSDPDATSKKDIPRFVEVYEIDGPFFFGVADKLKSVIDTIQEKPKVFILRMRKVPIIDSTGLHALKEFHLSCKKNGTRLLLSGVSLELEGAFEKFGFYKVLGKENKFDHIDKALEEARRHLSEDSKI